MSSSTVKQEGLVYQTNSCGECIITEHLGNGRVKVKFNNTGCECIVFLNNLKRGLVKDRSVRFGDEYVGKEFESKRSGKMVVVKYVRASEVTVKFLNTGTLKTTKLCHIISGSVADNFHPTVVGVGYLGEGYDLGNKTVNEKSFKLWAGMLERCYSKTQRSRNKTYEGCSVSENFKNLSYFKEWCSNQTGFNNEGWQLDKDILIKGNKLYSEETCCFVPQEINAMLTKNNTNRGELPIGVVVGNNGKFISNISSKNGFKGNLGTYETKEAAFLAYKNEKESRIKWLAEKWKNQIDSRVYEVLMNYQVEITD